MIYMTTNYCQATVYYKLLPSFMASLVSREYHDFIMQVSHLQINKIANQSLHHGYVCLHIVCFCLTGIWRQLISAKIQFKDWLCIQIIENLILRKIILNYVHRVLYCINDIWILLLNKFLLGI